MIPIPTDPGLAPTTPPASASAAMASAMVPALPSVAGASTAADDAVVLELRPPTTCLRMYDAAVAPAAAYPPLTTASGSACARLGMTREAPVMATPASASFSVLPHDCVMRGRSGEDGRSGARSVAGINSNSGPRGWCRRVPRRRAVGRAPGRTVAPVSVRVSPGNGGGGIHRDSSVSGPPDTRARTTTQVARPEDRSPAIRLPPPSSERWRLQGASAPENARDAALMSPTRERGRAFAQ